MRAQDSNLFLYAKAALALESYEIRLQLREQSLSREKKVALKTELWVNEGVLHWGLDMDLLKDIG